MFAAGALAQKALKNKIEKEGEDVDEKETIKKLQKPENKHFLCPVCGNEFNRKFNRDKHMELIHKIPRPDAPPLYPGKVEYIVPVEVKSPKKEEKAKPEKKDVEEKVKPEKEAEVEVMDTLPASAPEEKAPQIKRKRPDTLGLKPQKKPESSSLKKPVVEAKPWSKKELQAVIYNEKLLPVLTIYYCGQCLSPKNHKYIELPDKDAVVIVPICKMCNNLNACIGQAVKDVVDQIVKDL